MNAMNDGVSDLIIRIALTALVLAVNFIIWWGVLSVIHYFLSLPLRRAERARIFLDVLETAVKQGQAVEEVILSISKTGEASIGKRFHRAAKLLERGLSLHDALRKAPPFLPPQMVAMLRTGHEIGDLRKVLPACRRLLRDAVSQTWGAQNYLVLLTFAITPVSIFISLIMVQVVPKFLEISAGMEIGLPVWLKFLFDHSLTFVSLQLAILLVVWAVALVYVGGARLHRWFPVLDHLNTWLPWRKKRLQRDFSGLLAMLLDGGVPEPQAVLLAADGTANRVFKRSADRVIAALNEGEKLSDAIRIMDAAGQFRWRFKNAIHSENGFLHALAGWNESLDAKAFQQEQTAAHIVTSALVILNGLFVGVITTAVFMFLISLIQQAVLW